MYLLKFHNDTASFHARSLWYRYLRKISKSIVPSSTADDIDLLQILTVDTEIAENCIVESHFLNVSKCIPALDRFIYFLLTSILDYTRSMLQFEHCYQNIRYFNAMDIITYIPSVISIDSLSLNQFSILRILFSKVPFYHVISIS